MQISSVQRGTVLVHKCLCGVFLEHQRIWTDEMSSAKLGVLYPAFARSEIHWLSLYPSCYIRSPCLRQMMAIWCTLGN
jgi:hypothetical protein